MVTRLGWFGRRRSQVAFIQAAKTYGDPPGCELEVLSEQPEVAPTGQVLVDGVYGRPLPRSAQDEAMAAWCLAQARTGGGARPTEYGVPLHSRTRASTSVTLPPDG